MGVCVQTGRLIPDRGVDCVPVIVLTLCVRASWLRTLICDSHLRLLAYGISLKTHGEGGWVFARKHPIFGRLPGQNFYPC
jgi:hypothetical protein